MPDDTYPINDQSATSGGLDKDDLPFDPGDEPVGGSSQTGGEELGLYEEDEEA